MIKRCKAQVHGDPVLVKKPLECPRMPHPSCGGNPMHSSRSVSGCLLQGSALKKFVAGILQTLNLLSYGVILVHRSRKPPSDGWAPAGRVPLHQVPCHTDVSLSLLLARSLITGHSPSVPRQNNYSSGKSGSTRSVPEYALGKYY